MHNHNHEHNHSKQQKPVDHKELAQKLQSEVDVILSKISDKMLFAEFREDEVFTIQNGDKEEVIHQTLDERILVRPRRETTIERIDRTTTQAAVRITTAGRLVNYLFKPLSY